MLRHIRTLAMCALALLLLAPGCAEFTEANVRAFRDDAAGARDDLSAQLTQLESLRPGVPEGTPERAAIDASIAGARAKTTALDAAVARLDAALAEASDPRDALTIGARDVGALLPEPARLPLVLGAALAATFLRARQLKRGAASIADSLTKAMKTDPDMRAAFSRHADTLRTIQTPTARRIVDEQTKASPMLRLPI